MFDSLAHLPLITLVIFLAGALISTNFPDDILFHDISWMICADEAPFFQPTSVLVNEEFWVDELMLNKSIRSNVSHIYI